MVFMARKDMYKEKTAQPSSRLRFAKRDGRKQSKKNTERAKIERGGVTARGTGGAKGTHEPMKYSARLPIIESVLVAS